MIGGTDLVGLKSVFAKQLLFPVLGSVTTVLIGIAGRQIASERIGIVAGSIAAAYPGLWIYERNLNAETIIFPLIALVLIVAYAYRARPRWWLVLALGLIVGLLCLSRSEQILIVPLLVAPLILSTGDLEWNPRIDRLAAAGAMILLVLAPWTLYNLHRFEKPVILSTGFGYTAQAGACPSTFYGARLGGFDQVRCLFFLKQNQIQDATLRDDALRRAAFTYTSKNFGRVPVVIAAREGRTWGLFAPGQQISLNGQLLNAPSWVLWLQLCVYGIVLVLAVAGAVLLRRRRVPLYPLLAFPITVVLSTAITFGDSRYRAPAEVTLVILAAVAIGVATDHGAWESHSQANSAVA